MDTVTFIIAVVGLVLSIANLAWNIRTWLYKGARVKVEAARAFGLGENELYGDMLVIRARNVGRGKTSVTGWGLELPNGSHMPGHAVRLDVNKAVPCPLEGQHTENWYLIPKEIDKALLREGRGATKLVPFVELGNGQRVRGGALEWSLPPQSTSGHDRSG